MRNFAATSTEGQTLQAVAAELADSPQRQLRYTTDENARKDYAQAVEVGKTNQQALVAAHGVIRDYMATLATLASDGIVASNNAIAGLNKQLADSKLFSANANARDAFGKIAELISKAATDLYRRAKIRRVIDQASQSFPAAIGAIQRAVTNECVTQLNAESHAMDQYYELQSGLQDTNTPKWAIVLVEEIHDSRKSAVQDKIRVCQQYGLILGKIAAGHQAMVNSLNHLDAKELESTLKGYEQQISAIYDGIQKLKY